MDELLFKTENAFDFFKVQMAMTVDNGLTIGKNYIEQIRITGAEVLQDQKFDSVKITLNKIWTFFAENLIKLKNVTNTDAIIDQIRKHFRYEINKNNLYYVIIGICIGTTGGILIGIWLTKIPSNNQEVKSIACISYDGPDNVTLCNSPLPQMRHSTDILIRVRAVCINRLDDRISQGYGRTMRTLIHGNQNELPLIIGRGCAGIVDGIGKDSTGNLMIGDEVWLAAHWYEPGLASEIVIVPEYRVCRKPRIIGFEGAASLPYSGCIALNALLAAGLNELNCIGKRVLIQDGCSPVGCVLTQLLKKYGALVTATCYQRTIPVIKALGADDIIAFRDDDGQSSIDDDIERFNSEPTQQLHLFKELSIRPEYDIIFYTTSMAYDKSFISTFLAGNGVLIDTVEKSLRSDECGLLSRLCLSVYVKIKKIYSCITGVAPNWSESHLCCSTLNTLAELVNDGIVQTVVDQVYIPQDAEHAISHLCSSKSIGSTIVTFR